MSLPTLDELSKPLPREEIDVLARQFANEGEFVSVQTRFNYAWALIKAADQPSQRRGVAILTQLYRDSPDRRRETLYYLSIGCYKLGDYTSARRYADVLLDHEPTDPQVNKLRQDIEDKLNKEGLYGLAIVSGAVAVGAAILGEKVKLVQAQWDALPANGKPRVRPNGVKEWTVVAGVLVDGRVLAVASGVKAVQGGGARAQGGRKGAPSGASSGTQGTASPSLVHDMHAEILVLRALSRYVLDNALVSLGHIELVVSHTPCGDASMGQIQWDHATTEFAAPGLVRGRSGPHLKGVLRTKPGRADSPRVLSKSCSDKLALRQINGCLGSAATAQAGRQFVSDLYTPVTPDFERCFGRWNDKHVVPMRWHNTSTPWPSAEGDVPCVTSVVWTAKGPKHPGRLEVLCNGIRQGAKKTSPSARSTFKVDGVEVAKWYPEGWK